MTLKRAQRPQMERALRDSARASLVGRDKKRVTIVPRMSPPGLDCALIPSPLLLSKRRTRRIAKSCKRTSKRCCTNLATLPPSFLSALSSNLIHVLFLRDDHPSIKPIEFDALGRYVAVELHLS